MNERNARGADDLPELPDETVQRIEEAIFDEISGERELSQPTAEPTRRRRRIWPGVGIAAAAVVALAIVVPAAVQGIGGQSASDSSAGYVADEPAVGGYSSDAIDPMEDGAESSGTAQSSEDATDPNPESDDPAESGREVVLTGDAALRVDDVEDATDAIRRIVDASGGYVEGLSSRGDDEEASSSGWITVRVPADDLTAIMDELGDVGEVSDASLTTEDVTSTAIDLRSRVSALQASVDRLTELMAQSGSVADLLQAEQALSDRQADLEYYQQELDRLEGAVALSTLTVSLSTEDAAVAADPTGFGDGLAAGWGGMMTALNGLVVVMGFLLPWLIVAIVVAVVVRGAIRLRRRRRAHRRRDEPA